MPGPACRLLAVGPAVFLFVQGAAAQPAADPPAPDPAPQAEPAPKAEPPPQAEPPPAGDATEAAGPSEVTIVGTPLGQTAGSAHVINDRQLQRFEHDDPHAVLRAVPGVYARGEDGMGLRPNIGIRGVNPDRSKKVMLLEDGIPFAPAVYSAPAAYYFPIFTRMTQVRVIKGPAAIAYGPQTVAGAINLITRPIPTGLAGGLDAALGEYGHGKAHGHVGWSNERVGFLIEGVHLRNDGFKELPDEADTGFFRNEWMVKGSFVPDPDAEMRNEIRIKLGYSEEVSNETYLGLSDADFRENPLQRYGASALDRMANHRTSVALTHIFEPRLGISVTTTLYRNDFTRSWRKVNRFRGISLFDVLRDPDSAQNAVYLEVLRGQLDGSTSGEALLIGPNARDFVSQGIESRARWDTTTGPLSHRVEYGFRVHNDRVERRHSEDAFVIAGGMLVPEGSPSTVTAFNRASTDAFAMHLIDAVTWKRITITPGVRVESIRSSFVDRAENTEETQLSQAVMPGVGGFVTLIGGLGALAGVHRGFSPAPPGSEDHVEPEYSINWEAGLRYADGPARAEVIGYYNDYSNLTDVCTLSSGCVEENLDRQFDAGKARVYGLEAHVAHEIPIGPIKVPFSASYTLTQTEFLASFQSEDPIFGEVTVGDEIPYVPQHQVNASVGVEHHRAGGVVGVTYVSSMREEAGSEPLSEVLATDEQVTLDVGAWVRILEPLSVYGQVRNLLNAHDIVSRRPYGARPSAPRWIQVGAKVAF